ncbi:SET and MYND domain-containing protein 4 [Tiliqua scincoides]|uniref:SET and MYND domain-containing protein 4 n=1 Tax=Tiliqua scincoides TaxID=71010 RepID=UPI003463550B
MDLPVEKWKIYVTQKWSLLAPSLKKKLSHTASLRDIFLLSLTHFHPEDNEYLHNLSRYHCVKKDPRLALSYKEKGNERFQKKAYRSAAALYSKALSHTEIGSPEMAVCYANRSAAFFYLGQFEVCLEDIGRAQVEGYPNRLYPKILRRKAECLLSLGRLQEAAETLSDLENKMSLDPNLKAATHQMLLNKFSQMKVKTCKEKHSLVSQPTGLDSAQKDLEHWEENSRISCASASLSLDFSTCKGRHLVAAKDIIPGEILLREEAFVSVLCPGENFILQGTTKATLDEQHDNEDLHCHCCLRQLVASVPCQGCSYAKYCSSVCAQLAWKNYHRIECSLGGLLLTLGVLCHVTLRAVLVAGFTEVCTLVKQLHGGDVVESCKAVTKGDSASIPGCDADGQYSSSYQTVFSLLPHTEKHSPEFQFLCSLCIAALCKRLEDTGLTALIVGKSISECPGESKAAKTSPELKILGEAMLRHMLQLRCNAHAITTLRESGSGDGPVASSEQVRLATAIFPVVSLLNHSCDPNTSVAFNGTTVEIRALQPVLRGQEILHCYGPHRCRMIAIERRKQLLSQYFFECQCQACLAELCPNSTKKAAPHNVFCCPDCHMPMQGSGMLHCSSEACKVLVPEDRFQCQLHDLQLLIETALELLGNGKPGQSVELLLKCRLVAKRFLSPEHLIIGEIEDHLAQAYVTLEKWQEAAGHLQCSIQIVEAHYGSSSAEVGQELFKLAQVLFNGRIVLEALHTIQKAEKVLSVHFGTQSTQVQELQEMKVCLEEFLGNLNCSNN